MFCIEGFGRCCEERVPNMLLMKGILHHPACIKPYQTLETMMVMMMNIIIYYYFDYDDESQ